MSADPLGAGAGALSQLSDDNLSNEFSTIPDQSVEAVTDRVNPDQVTSGTTRGTQTYPGTDGSRLTMGVVDDNQSLIAEAQYDAKGKKISQLGQQADGTSGLKFFDNTSGIGIAQFGTKSDGSVSLRVAKSGIEVGSATDDQLVFNSSQNMFKIVKTGTSSIPARNLGTASFAGETITIVHGLNYVPIVQAFGQFPIGIGSLSGGGITSIPGYVQLPYNQADYGGLDSHVGTYQVYAVADATNIYIQYYYTTTGAGGYNFPAVPIKYYLLQESAN